MELLIEHGELVRRGAVLARAAEAHPQRELEHVELGDRDEPDRGRTASGELGERLERAVQVGPHERPAQTPAVLGVDVAGRRDHVIDRHGLGAHVALVTRDADLDPRPPLHWRIGIRALPRERREAQEAAGLSVHPDDGGPLHREVVRGDRLCQHEDVAFTGHFDHEARIGPSP